jgi:hypothetical protein
MLLKCKDVARLASDYLDNNTSLNISLRLRWHLMLCANCRRFVKHLETTKVVTAQLADPASNTDADAVWARLKVRMMEEKK